MPTRADQLTKDSAPDAVKSGISDCIAQMMNEDPNMKQEQAIAACYSMAEKSTGRMMKPKSMSVSGTTPPMMPPA